MKKFFLLVAMLASTSVFATYNKKCVWNFAPSSTWTCESGTAGTLSSSKYVTGVSCWTANTCSNIVLLDDCLTRGVNCGKFQTAQTFDFNVKAGGANVNLYVCEAGFANRHCKDCGKNILRFFSGSGNALTQVNGVESTDAQATAAFVERFWTFTKAQNVSSASLWLNSLNTDAGFYVKWCLDVKRVIVGRTLADFGANIPVFSTNDRITFTPGGVDNRYFDVAGLKAFVFKKCGGSLVRGLPAAYDAAQPTAGAFVLNDFQAGAQTTLDLGGDLTVLDFLNSELNFGPDTICGTGHCSWTVLYKEMNNCILRDLDYGPDTQLNNCTTVEGCKPREAKLSTTLDLAIDFCPDNSCI